MVFGTRVLEYRVLGPSGFVYVVFWPFDPELSAPARLGAVHPKRRLCSLFLLRKLPSGRAALAQGLLFWLCKEDIDRTPFRGI